MKKRLSVNVYGGLGNNLFQIATGFATSLKYRMDFCVDTSNYHGGKNGISFYRKNILRNVEFCHNPHYVEIYGEQGHDFHEIPKPTNDTKINGYFQTEKYFIEYRQEVIDLFKPTEQTKSKIEEKYGHILNNITTSVHVRRGDYLHLKEHYVNLDMDYFNKAVDIIGNNNTFLIFSDEIDWWKNNFKHLENVYFVDDLEDFESLYLMSYCTNNIISNSTFGWWGAWLNQNSKKNVIGPKEWFGINLSQFLKTDDIICDTWTKI